MSAARYDFYIDQGQDFSEEFQLLDSLNRPISLVGATIAGKIDDPYDNNSPVATFTGTLTTPDEGKFKVALTAAQTSAIEVDASPGDCERPDKCYLYDIVVTYASGLKERVLNGTVYISPEVT